MELLWDALLDSLKQIPFLFVAYIIVEWLEGRETLNRSWAKKIRRSGPLSGALMGLVPQCGFSVFTTSLYTKKLITVGTLLAVYLSTSDEAIPLILAHPDKVVQLIPLLSIKLVYAIFVGYSADALLKKREAKRLRESDASAVEKAKAQHVQGCCGHDYKEKRMSVKELVLHPAVHTAKVFLYIFIISALLNTAIAFLGEDKLAALMLNGSVFQPMVAALIGLIPNCVASIAITELYLAGGIGFGSVVAGLCSSAGLGLLLLFKENKNFKENVLILLTLYCSSVVLGMALTIFVR